MEYAVATFPDIADVSGSVVIKENKTGITITTSFTKLPSGQHGFHIHKNGDLRGQGCLGACEHYNKGPKSDHGGPRSKVRHTGDLGNISLTDSNKRFYLKNVSLADLYGRSIIVHEDVDDLGLGPYDDSKTTGHSGKRLACAIIGRATAPCVKKTRKEKTKSK